MGGAPGSGLTRLGYRMLAEPSLRASVVVVDVRGWVAPSAAWEAGVEKRHLVVVRCPDRMVWPRVVAALCEGVNAVYAEVPEGVTERDLRRLAALARARQVRMVLRPVKGSLPPGVAHLRLQAKAIEWRGAGRGHGSLTVRRLTVEASGKGAAGMTRVFEMEDSGADLVRVVSPMVARATGRAG